MTVTLGVAINVAMVTATSYIRYTGIILAVFGRWVLNKWTLNQVEISHSKSHDNLQVT